MDYLKYFQEKFPIEEIVPRKVYKTLGEAAWHLFDPELLKGAGWLRKHLGPAICNNWHTGGNFQWSGLRTPESPHYSPTSQHTVNKGRLCSALDLKFTRHTAEEARALIRALDKEKCVPCITRIEDEVNWIHIDTKPMPGHTEIYFFKP